jgi:hypothetical protein
METTNKYHMSFEEAQEYISKRGLDIPWNDGDVFIDEREIVRTVGNVLKWADDTMVEKGVVWLFENVCYYPEQGYIAKAYEDEMKVKL